MVRWSFESRYELNGSGRQLCAAVATACGFTYQ
jgi:hypothetical protein